MNESRSSSLERLLNVLASWSVIIHRTSASSHVLYVPFNSILVALRRSRSSRSLKRRFNGSGFSATGGVFVTLPVSGVDWVACAGVVFGEAVCATTPVLLHESATKAIPGTTKRDKKIFIG